MKDDMKVTGFSLMGNAVSITAYLYGGVPLYRPNVQLPAKDMTWPELLELVSKIRADLDALAYEYFDHPTNEMIMRFEETYRENRADADGADGD